MPLSCDLEVVIKFHLAHAGDPAALGIADLDVPDFGEAAEFEPGDVPVFWACGVTLQAAVMASRPPFAITHAPGHMLITDAWDEDYGVDPHGADQYAVNQDRAYREHAEEHRVAG